MFWLVGRRDGLDKGESEFELLKQDMSDLCFYWLYCQSKLATNENTLDRVASINQTNISVRNKTSQKTWVLLRVYLGKIDLLFGISNGNC